MSPVGAGSHSMSEPIPRTSNKLADEDEDEEVTARGTTGCPAGADGALDLLLHGGDAHLPDQLQLARDPAVARGAGSRPRAMTTTMAADRGPECVEVDGEAEQLALDVDTDRDVGRPESCRAAAMRYTELRSRMPGRHDRRPGVDGSSSCSCVMTAWPPAATFAMSMNWKTASPTRTPKPSGGDRKTSPRAMTVMRPRRRACSWPEVAACRRCRRRWP